MDLRINFPKSIFFDIKLNILFACFISLFCTNTYMANVNVHYIMAISGHKTEKVFLNYVKVEKRFEAIKIAEHPHFQ